MRNEQMMGELVALFTVLAIFIACLGLYGLSAYLSTQRRKEIGIRKILGASTNHVLELFGRQYSWLIIISFVIAVPAALYIMQQWLAQFAFRISLSWWIPVSCCLLVLFIALLTVGYHSLKATRVNPADILRSE